LAHVNPSLLQRVMDQVVHSHAESPEHTQVAEQIRHMLLE